MRGLRGCLRPGTVACAFVVTVVSWAVVGSSLQVALAEDAEQVEAVQEASSAEEKKESDKPTKRAHRKPLTVADDPRGPSDLTVCSQNLKLFGTVATIRASNPKYTREVHVAKVEALASRFAKANCDVIALQEVMGATEAAGKEALDDIIRQLKRITNRTYVSRVSPPDKGGMTLGYLVAQDRASILNAVSYEKVDLPKLVEKQRPRVFLRTPMELQLSVAARNSQDLKTISLVNFHFKSKRGGASDPTGLEWETYRMEMAEALRRILDARHQQSFASSESLLIALGDRNGNYDVASARILEGSLVLSNFKKDGGCRLSKRGVPLCKVDIVIPQRLFSVFAHNDRVHSLPGTFSYQGEYSWLDDILMPAESLPYAWKGASSEGQYESGVVYAPKDASDHAMVYVKLNWGAP